MPGGTVALAFLTAGGIVDAVAASATNNTGELVLALLLFGIDRVDANLLVVLLYKGLAPCTSGHPKKRKVANSELRGPK